MKSMDGIWYLIALQRLSYSKCQGNVRIAVISLSSFFDDCYQQKEKYFHSGHLGTEGYKQGFKSNSDALLVTQLCFDH